MVTVLVIKEILLEIGFIEEMKLLEIIKLLLLYWYLQTYATSTDLQYDRFWL